MMANNSFTKRCFVDGELWSNATYNISSSTRKSAMCNFETTPVLCANLHKCAGKGSQHFSASHFIMYMYSYVYMYITCMRPYLLFGKRVQGVLKDFTNKSSLKSVKVENASSYPRSAINVWYLCSHISEGDDPFSHMPKSISAVAQRQLTM